MMPAPKSISLFFFFSFFSLLTCPALSAVSSGQSTIISSLSRVTPPQATSQQTPVGHRDTSNAAQSAFGALLLIPKSVISSGCINWDDDPRQVLLSVEQDEYGLPDSVQSSSLDGFPTDVVDADDISEDFLAIQANLKVTFFTEELADLQIPMAAVDISKADRKLRYRRTKPMSLAMKSASLKKFNVGIYVTQMIQVFLGETSRTDQLIVATSLLPFAGCITDYEGKKAAGVRHQVQFAACMIGDALLFSPMWPVGALLHLIWIPIRVYQNYGVASTSVSSVIYDPNKLTEQARQWLEQGWQKTVSKASAHVASDSFGQDVRRQWDAEVYIVLYRAAVASRRLRSGVARANANAARLQQRGVAPKLVARAQHQLEMATCKALAHRFTRYLAGLRVQAIQIRKNLYRAYVDKFQSVAMERLLSEMSDKQRRDNETRLTLQKKYKKMLQSVMIKKPDGDVSMLSIFQAITKALDGRDPELWCRVTPSPAQDNDDNDAKVMAVLRESCGLWTAESIISKACPVGLCCGADGFCGNEAKYCDAGCQPQYGQCSSQRPPFRWAKKPSGDGTCGPGGGQDQTCTGSVFGECCGAHGICGSDDQSCYIGCQEEYGECRRLLHKALFLTITGRCGDVDGEDSGAYCHGSTYGSCCSKHGYCGDGPDYCDKITCQKQFGLCKTNDDAPPSPPPNASPDGQCGLINNGYTCLRSVYGQCCGAGGVCGKTPEYCGGGCQEGFGLCDRVDSNADQEASPSSNSSSLGTCGVAGGRFSCFGSVLGDCCGKGGVCGSDDDTCDILKGCDPRYGRCVFKQAKPIIKTASLIHVSESGTCGFPGVMRSCLGSKYGNCCGRGGTCGTGIAFCGSGCQQKFGACADLKVTTNGQCGPAHGNTTCYESGFGQCCSSQGVCGVGAGSCERGCQLGYGECTAMRPGADVSPDGRCGPYRGGFTCSGSGHGECCSQHGHCGNSAAYCNGGCQVNWGTCYNPDAAIKKPAALVSTNGLCGPKHGGTTCKGSGWGECCSRHGSCGSDASHCSSQPACFNTSTSGCTQAAACDPGYGHCWASRFEASVSVHGLCNVATAYTALQTCHGSAWGDCCSFQGHCGRTDAYCQVGRAKGCQKDLGLCECYNKCGRGIDVGVFANPFLNHTPQDANFTSFDPSFFLTSRPLMTDKIDSFRSLDFPKYVRMTGLESIAVVLRTFVHACDEADKIRIRLSHSDDIALVWTGVQAVFGSSYETASLRQTFYARSKPPDLHVAVKRNEFVPLRILLANSRGVARFRFSVSMPDSASYSRSRSYNGGNICYSFPPWGGETLPDQSVKAWQGRKLRGRRDE